MQGRRHEVGTRRTSASRRLQRRLHLRVAAGAGGRRLGACGAGSACESRPAKKAAVTGRWAGVPIDPFAYGSGTSEFALRNLRKSPDCRVGALPHLRAPTRRRRPLTCGDWRRFRAAGRGSGAHSTCGRQAGRVEGVPHAHFFEVRCSLVGKTAVRAHFLQLVAAPRRTSRAYHEGDFVKPQVRKTMVPLAVFWLAAETSRTPSQEPEKACNRATNLKKCARTAS